MFDIDPTDEVTLSAADYAQMLEEIKSLRNSLAESGRLHEDMKLGGKKMAESLRFAKASVESLEAENAALHAECDRLTAMLGPQKVLSAEEEIKPCPFCGSAEIVMSIDLCGPEWMSHLMCESCCATKGSDVFPTQDESELATISEWNRRANEGEGHDK